MGRKKWQKSARRRGKKKVARVEKAAERGLKGVRVDALRLFLRNVYAILHNVCVMQDRRQCG